MHSKGQGALEYLLLAGGAIVVAAILVTLLLSTSSGSLSVSKISLINDQLKKYQALGQLQGRYSFENNTQDTSGKGNHGTGFTGSYPAGRIGSGITGGTVQIPVNTFNGLGDFTFTTWVKTSSNNFTITIGSAGAPNTWPLWVFVTPGPPMPQVGLQVQLAGGSSGAGGNITLADGQWHHIALVRQGTTESTYFDCQLLGTAAVPATALTQTSLQNVESSAATLDEIYVIKRSLSAAEIKTLAGC